MTAQTPAPWRFVAVALLLGLIALVLLLLVDRPREGREHASMARGTLRGLAGAQMVFRQGDKDGDGTLDYGTLSELAAAQLIDAPLGSGTKLGYTFVCQPGADPLATWFAFANPIPGSPEQRAFFVNQDGVIHARDGSPITVAEVKSGCLPPAGCAPLP
ncbi:MAG: hypothetical protein AB7N76_28015 [Planctomycetota bacterium]